MYKCFEIQKSDIIKFMAIIRLNEINIIQNINKSLEVSKKKSITLMYNVKQLLEVWMILIKNKLYNLSKFQRKLSYGKIRFLGNILGINWNSWVTLTLDDNCIVYPINHTCNGFEKRLIWKWIWSILFWNNAKKKTIDTIKCIIVEDTYFFFCFWRKIFTELPIYTVVQEPFSTFFVRRFRSIKRSSHYCLQIVTKEMYEKKGIYITHSLIP